jgi:hypothetical protein
VQRDDRHGTTLKGNDSGKWSSDDVVLLPGRRENGDTIEWWRE